MLNCLPTKLKASKQSIADSFVYIVVPVVCFVIYLLTLAPDYTWAHDGADGGDFAGAIITGRLPHPPGFPLYLFLGRLFSFIPLGSIAWRLNLLSAIMASGAVYFTGLSLRGQPLSIWSISAASLSLGFAPLFWSQAVITEVYTTAAFFLSFTQYLCTRALYKKQLELPVGITWGMAIAVHPTTALTAYYVWTGRKRVWNGIIAGIVTSLIFYTSLLFYTSGAQKWADITKLRGWIDYISGRIYWNYAFNLPLSYMPRRIISWLTLFSQQFTPIGAVLVLVGLFQWYRLAPKRAAAFIFSLSLITLYALSYNSIDSYVYFVPIMPLVIILLGQGMDWLITHGIPGCVMLVIPLLLVVSQWQSISLHNDKTVALWLDRVFTKVPDGAVIFTEEDPHTFALWYAQEVAGMRDDVLVVDKRLWEFPPYRNNIQDVIGWAPANIEDLHKILEICVVDNKGVVCQ